MVSMMNVRKDLLKFVTLDKVFSISTVSWIKGLITAVGISCVII